MKTRKRIVYIIALFSFLFSYFYFIPNIVGAESIEDEVVIDRYPEEAIFKLENMKPGDTAYRTLIIQNNHDRDLLYTMQLVNLGEEKLYNELLLRITYKDEIVFYGKLKDYTGVIDRPLSSNTEELVEFDLKFPEELGNEYQGLLAEFLLEFTARAASDSGIVGGVATGSGNPISGADGNGSSGITGGILPQTATSIFTYLLIGGVLLIIGGTASYLSKKKGPVNE